MDWSNRNDINSAEKLDRVIKEDQAKNAEERQHETYKERNNWKRAFITWTLSSIAIIISIISLVISLWN
ncbi:hypothetical protein [Spiroplasma platyhelix]|uniref:Uncharacterized protein n=1 Tax=Spiroplasma platyhelix PALS-1 TaxID=1276218 RepID=A0A846UDE8_9MOLU|nr:hypothetical protein [Spiroplasma platyhelix]MBE4704157.1 hypothetical protein [Spiroplasma platyhelix PALS-1]NKE38528.1 hypothetical protein [Spiroplasma platyhelix PALS-1]UJB29415.1 hypothetical protein SPLAT_v1c06510 [Spiroplasma platyhelix PALS-1]